MMNMWTHPEYSGGLGAPKRARDDFSYVRQEASSHPLSRDVVSVFFRTCVVSICGFLAVLLWEGVPIGEQGSDVPRFQGVRSLASRALGYDLTGQAFLAGELFDEAYHLRSQVRFLSSIIKSHLSAMPEANQLAYLIVSESLRANYDPLFVAAVIRSESTFQRSAKSKVGARGLMQIMPDTGQFLSKLQNVAWSGTRTLHDPHINLRLGIAYLKYLEQKFNGNRERVLVAYNWGPGNVDVAIRSRSPLPTQPLQYARKIILTHRTWKKEFTQLASSSERKAVAGTLG